LRKKVARTACHKREGGKDDDALDEKEQQKEMIPQVSRQCLRIQLHMKDERKEFEQ
jgi:hypothetical protein